MKRELSKGQSILEYTLLLGVIVGVIVFALLGGGGVKEKVVALYNKTGSTIGNVTNNMNTGVFGF